MTPSELLARYTSDVANLSSLINQEKTDPTAYRYFGEALELAWRGARRAAASYVRAEEEKEREEHLDVKLSLHPVARSGIQSWREGGKDGEK